jgi:hypothetical protein
MNLNARELRPEDYKKAMELHAAMDLGYDLDIESPDIIVKAGMFDEDRLVAVGLERITTEGYLLLDKKWGTPQDRLDVSTKIIGVAISEVRLHGVLDTSIWLPPKASSFAKRLKKMGFVQAPWPCLTVRV